MKVVKNILCYGDSNTWGLVPGSMDTNSMSMSRYCRSERWPGILQNKLGSEYFVIEEGLNGRTTNLEALHPPDRNGLKLLPVSLYSHAPLSLVILFIGGNDLKAHYKWSPGKIAARLIKLVRCVNNTNYGDLKSSPPQVLVVSPIIPKKTLEQYQDDSGCFVFKDCIARSKELVESLEDVLAKESARYLNISQKVYPSEIDGAHLDCLGHEKLASLVMEEVISLIGSNNGR